MTSHSIDQLKYLWRISVPLSCVWVEYGEPKLKARWEELQKVSAITAFDDAAQQVRDAECSPVEKMQMLWKKPQEILTAREEVERKLKQNILTYISQGHAHAYGFEAPREVANAPVYIPKSTWAGKVDWYERTLSHQGLEFVEVRITTNRIRNEILDRGNVTVKAPTPAGRPTIGPSIQAAFKALEKSGEIDLSASQRSHYPKIQAWLELNAPDLNVPAAQISDKTIHKYFSPLFKDLKKVSNL